MAVQEKKWEAWLKKEIAKRIDLLKIGNRPHPAVDTYVSMQCNDRILMQNINFMLNAAWDTIEFDQQFTEEQRQALFRARWSEILDDALGKLEALKGAICNPEALALRIHQEETGKTEFVQCDRSGELIAVLPTPPIHDQHCNCSECLTERYEVCTTWSMGYAVKPGELL